MWPDKANASFYITKRMRYLAGNLRGDYLFGDRSHRRGLLSVRHLALGRRVRDRDPRRLLGLRQAPGSPAGGAGGPREAEGLR